MFVKNATNSVKILDNTPQIAYNIIKYNLSNIMKRAWELVKKAGMTISSGLKKAWKEAKNMGKKIKMNVCRNEYFTVDTATGKITGKTYNAKEWIKRNFDAKWNKEEKCWEADPELIQKELENERYYGLYIIVEEEENKEEIAEDEIVSRELVNRKDGFYSENTHKSGKITYTFVG